MTYINHNGLRIGMVDSDVVIGSASDILDLFVTASYLEGATGLMLFKESLPEEFFDLKTGFAGDILQKFSNYRMKLAIIGDFSKYPSKSLKDFIYECNKGRLIFFKPDKDSALAALTNV